MRYKRKQSKTEKKTKSVLQQLEGWHQNATDKTKDWQKK